jgi:hypothetical protein
MRLPSSQQFGPQRVFHRQQEGYTSFANPTHLRSYPIRIPERIFGDLKDGHRRTESTSTNLHSARMSAMDGRIDSLVSQTGAMDDKISSLDDKINSLTNQTAKHSSYLSTLESRITEQLSTICEHFQSTREGTSTELVRIDPHGKSDALSPVPLETALRSSRSRRLSQAGLLDPIPENEERNGQSKPFSHPTTVTFPKGIVWHSKIAETFPDRNLTVYVAPGQETEPPSRETDPPLRVRRSETRVYQYERHLCQTSYRRTFGI